MRTVDERLREVTLKVERAKKHVSDLQHAVRAFANTNPYRVSTERDPQTRKLIYYVASAQPAPPDLALIAGDALQCLASALDHLAYQIVCADTNDAPPNHKWIYFPIRDNSAEYEAKKAGKMQGARPESFAALDALKPYKGGNDLLWAIKALNDVEKHRLLLTVGSQTAGFNVGQDMARRFGHQWNDLASMNIFVRPADAGFPLKEGFELFAGGIDDEPNPNQQFRFEIALSEPGIIEGKPLLETLHQMTALVEGIVSALSHRLR